MNFIFLVERREPLPNGGAQVFDAQTAMLCGEGVELIKAGTQERFCPPQVIPRVVVECGGYLDESLQESFLGRLRAKPDFLPGFVSLKKPP